VKLCDAELDEEEEDEDGPAPLLLLTAPCTAFCFWYHCGGDGSAEVATASASGDAVPSGVVEPPPLTAPAATGVLGVAVGLSAGCVQVLKMPQEKSARGVALSFGPAPPPAGCWCARLICLLPEAPRIVSVAVEAGRRGAWRRELLLARVRGRAAG
jgi:hypothetical protein